MERYERQQTATTARSNLQPYRAHRSGSPDNHRIRGIRGNLYAERNRLLQLKVIVWSEIAASRCPAKLPMPAKEQVWEHLVSNSAVAGGLERYFIPSEEAPQEKAAVIRLVLTTRVPKIAFEDSCLQFANSIIEAGGGVYPGKNFTDDVYNFVVVAPTQKTDAISKKQ